LYFSVGLYLRKNGEKQNCGFINQDLDPSTIPASSATSMINVNLKEVEILQNKKDSTLVNHSFS
jgi:hypothetical protein